MVNQTVAKKSITISRKTIQKNGGVVILGLKEYRDLCEKAVPTYYLKGKEAKELDKLVKEGLEEYERGEAVEANSMREAMRKHERERNKKN